MSKRSENFRADSYYDGELHFSKKFSLRLNQLRVLRGVSARDMSISIGQNPAYINNIENGKALPSMTAFFFICEYLSISPSAFFDTESQMPGELADICEKLKKLSPKQLEAVHTVVSSMAK